MKKNGLGEEAQAKPAWPEWKGYDTRYFCRTCGEEVQATELRTHRMDHIRNGDVWSAPCKLDCGNALCIKKNLYDGCICTTNWRCFRDGIMIQNDDNQPATVAPHSKGGRAF